MSGYVVQLYASYKKGDNALIKNEMIPAAVEVIRSARKTLSISIADDGHIIARAPLRMSERDIERFIVSKTGWIRTHIEKRREENSRVKELERFTPEEIKEMAEKALKIIPERVKYYASLLNVTYGRITIRNQKTKWGSCSSAGNLNFNCLLVMTPPEVLDAIVVHELCHRKQMNHSKQFYAEVYRVYPEYDKWNSWLKENGSVLIKRMTG